jgi:hypothetical protein
MWTHLYVIGLTAVAVFLAVVVETAPFIRF